MLLCSVTPGRWSPRPAMKNVVLALTASLGLAACGCLEEVSLRPELTVSDVAKAQAGTGSVEVIWRFKDCCPSSEQEAIALRLQEGVAELWDRLVRGEVDVDRYNTLVRAAHKAITEVILVCSARDEGRASERSAAAAWSDCSRVADRISTAVR